MQEFVVKTNLFISGTALLLTLKQPVGKAAVASESNMELSLALHPSPKFLRCGLAHGLFSPDVVVVVNVAFAWVTFAEQT